VILSNDTAQTTEQIHLFVNLSHRQCYVQAEFVSVLIKGPCFPTIIANERCMVDTTALYLSDLKLLRWGYSIKSSWATSRLSVECMFQVFEAASYFFVRIKTNF